MRIDLHIGPQAVGADRLQSVLSDKRGNLEQNGVLYPRTPGRGNHTRLFMAVTDPDHVDPLRFNRGFLSAQKQSELHTAVLQDLQREIAAVQPSSVILSALQLGTSLHRVSELERLRDLLKQLTDDIRIIAHVDDPAATLARNYATQVMEGRATKLDVELEIGDDWWANCLQLAPKIDPIKGQFIETQTPPFWLDTSALVSFWEKTFGEDTVHLRVYDSDLWASEAVTEELQAAFKLDFNISKAKAVTVQPQPSAASLARTRQLNALLLHVLGKGKHILPRPLWRSFHSEMAVEGPPIDPASLSEISERFADSNTALAKKHGFTWPEAQAPTTRWSEADPTKGYRASQYLLAFSHRIGRATRIALKARAEQLAQHQTSEQNSAKTPSPLLPPTAVEKFNSLITSRFAPHNRLGQIDETLKTPDYDYVAPRKRPKGQSGNVIVACMKNEAPYIVEWVAYHRAIGVDNFLIYTNDCTDGTAEILDQLQTMGVLQHRDNSDWKGNSPQQHALNLALDEPVVKNADWLIHIDVDEFMNIRCGNGTLDDFFDHVPDATNVAMTWRLFGHNDVTRLNDTFVIEQFDACAPKFCPKPHTAWGFKTMFRNIGAYAKMSCHRPNKLNDALRDKVKWVNGSGVDMTKEAADNGWRNSLRTVGYDLLQLNHYALRSAESFLIKRQRGRALHVDRSIGLNYWIRMDWNDTSDITIKRNIPRVRVEYDALMSDQTLKSWHDHGLAWHRAKAHELHSVDEFKVLYSEALKIKLNATERVAYALALDMES